MIDADFENMEKIYTMITTSQKPILLTEIELAQLEIAINISYKSLLDRYGNTTNIELLLRVDHMQNKIYEWVKQQRGQ